MHNGLTMRTLLYLSALLALLFISCSRQNPEEMAARVAKQYYDYLLEGKYEAFVDGQHRPEKIPDSYREQLVMNIKMFMGQQEREHLGIKETRIVKAVADTSRHEANVFMVFCYGDSTTEQVCIPMVEDGGVWYMR